MAPTPGLSAYIRSPDQSILSLSKGPESFDSKVEKAFEVLGIEQDNNVLNLGTQGVQSGDFDPKCEYVARWLLKNFSQDNGPSGYCQSLPGWRLLCSIIQQINAPKLARLLKETGFVSILARNLSDLSSRLRKIIVQVTGDGIQWLETHSEVLLDGDRLEAVTSKDLDVDSSSPRLRDLLNASEDSSNEIRLLSEKYSIIWELIRRIQTLCDQKSFQRNHHNAEHIRHALRGSLEAAAAIYGTTLSAIYDIESCYQYRLDSKDDPDPNFPKFNEHFETILTLWELQSLRIGNDDRGSLNKLFVDHCMLPTLEHLGGFADLSGASELGEWSKRMRALVMKHILLPARLSFQAASSQKEREDERNFFEYFAHTLQEHLGNSSSLHSLTTTSASSLQSMNGALVMFFDIAALSVPRNDAKTRRAEQAWLRQLFKTLSSGLEAYWKLSSSPGARKLCALGIRNLLNRAVELDVSLDVSTVQLLIEQWSTLLNNEVTSVDWSLISLCIANNAEVFVAPVAGDSQGAYTYRPPNKYLVALFSKLKTTWLGKNQDWEITKQELTQNITIPLLQAFVKARDLLGFFEHFREQLNTSEESEETGAFQALETGKENLSVNPWEDDELSITAAGLVERNLSNQQIDSVIALLRRRLNSSVNEDGIEFGFGDSVVLDCLLSGCRSEEILEHIEAHFRFLFESLSKVVGKQSEVPDRHRWRLWRTLQTISQSWVAVDEANTWIEPIRETVSLALRNFEEIITATYRGYSDDYRELASLFGFIVSCFPLEENEILLSAPSSMRSLIAKIMLQILDKLDHTTATGANQDVSKTPKISDIAWDGKLSKVQNLNDFFLSCMAQLLQIPTAISCLEKNIQFCIFEAIFEMAIDESQPSNTHEREQTQKTQGFKWVLQNLFLCEDYNSQKQFRNNLRNFMFRKYVDGAYPHDMSWSHRKHVAHRMALDQVLRASIAVFNRDQRASIANRALEDLLQPGAKSPEVTIMQTKLLLDACRFPNQSMNILRRTEHEKSIRLPDAASSDISSVFLLAWQSDQIPDLHTRSRSRNLLGRLTQRIVRHICSTLNEDSSRSYLLSFCQFLESDLAPAGEDHMSRHNTWTSESAVLLVSMAGLEVCRENLDHIMEHAKSQGYVVNDLRRRHLSRILSALSHHDNSGNLLSQEKLVIYVHGIGIYAEHLDQCSDLDPALTCLEKQIRLLLASEPTELQNDGILGREEMIARTDQMLHKISLSCRQSHSLVPEPYKVFEHVRSVDPRDSGDLVAMLSEEQYEDLLGSKVFERLLRAKDVHQLAILRSIVYRVQATGADKHRSQLLNGLYHLIDTLPSQSDHRAQALAMQSIALLLRRLPRLVNQYHIDSALSSIAICAYDLNSTSLFSRSAITYTGLCQIFNTILIVHRPKISGRYHLVVPALQALMKCLFTPYPTKDSIEDSASEQPYPTIGKANAQAFTRLLTALCDPSPSAVTRSSKGRSSREQLNDETKRAKHLAGQYMQYLIMTYCECQLNGQLVEDNDDTEGMKQALEPGLWAALGCMSPNIMRAMSAALDGSARVIWKKLYDDWKEFGQWKGG